MNFENHPCFNDKKRHTYGRIHLPVAPRCNIQCNFCNRKFDCVNESRPGVTSGILSPHQALLYLDEVMAQKPNISVVGIAGPGDPFANPEETLETLRMVRAKYPEMILCIATNGLNLRTWLDDLKALMVSHVTVTVNAVDPAIGEKIYSWVRHNKRVRRADEGAAILLENQLAAIKGLKERNMTVKVNTIIIPGVNDLHAEEVAQKMALLDVDILNCVPYYPNEGANFEHIPEPPKEMIKKIRKTAGKYIKQMHHCTRCRADAVGLLGEKPDPGLMRMLQTCADGPEKPAPSQMIESRPNIAVASMEGLLVNQHLGEATRLLIFEKNNNGYTLKEARPTPGPGGGNARWEALANSISDCGTLLVSGIGQTPEDVLSQKGITALKVEGLIEDAIRGVYEGTSLNHMIKQERASCGAECTGTGMGCG